MQETLQISHNDRSIYDIPDDQVQAVLDKVIVKPSDDKLLKVATLSHHYKMLIHIIHQCFIGLVGSKDQISSEQQKMLTAIVSDEEWDWESVFTCCLAEHKASALRKSKKFRTGLKVSSVILKSTPGVSWPNPLAIPKNLVYHEKPTKGTTSKKISTSSKVALNKVPAKSSTASPSEATACDTHSSPLKKPPVETGLPPVDVEPTPTEARLSPA